MIMNAVTRVANRYLSKVAEPLDKTLPLDLVTSRPSSRAAGGGDDPQDP